MSALWFKNEQGNPQRQTMCETLIFQETIFRRNATQLKPYEKIYTTKDTFILKSLSNYFTINVPYKVLTYFSM